MITKKVVAKSQKAKLPDHESIEVTGSTPPVPSAAVTLGVAACKGYQRVDLAITVALPAKSASTEDVVKAVKRAKRIADSELAASAKDVDTLLETLIEKYR